MDELIQFVTQKTGLPEDQARSAAQSVIDFLKQRLPGPVAEQLDSALSGDAGAGLVDKVKGMAGSVFGRG
jgi:uncharacterized protein (DUF2267 family)